jgi:23S rRNA (cytidine2498-2'-O)-methyltransferase
MRDSFVFVGCKYGYENQCKSEVLRSSEKLKFAFSRPGFQTFKMVDATPDFSKINRLTFVRIAGLNKFRIGIENDSLSRESLGQLNELVDEFKPKAVHFWNRNLGEPNDELLLGSNQQQSVFPVQGMHEWIDDHGLRLNRPAKIGDQVLNLIEVDVGNVWAGIHHVETLQQCWPGGVIQFSVPDKMVSRAFLKARESMLWSRFPFQKQDTCLEIGCAPGGSVQALLEENLNVVGIDPAPVDPSIASHPNFFQIQKRGSEVKKKMLADADWLFADANVAPGYSLDTIEDIVTNQHVHIQGMIITIKLLQEQLADQIKDYVERVRNMGFKYVRARQLAFNRNEVCIAALRRKSLLRFGKLKKKSGRVPREES